MEAVFDLPDCPERQSVLEEAGIPADRNAPTTASASAADTATNSAPEAISPSGSRPSAPQIRSHSAETSIDSRSIRIPTPAFCASSARPVARPPSVGSCIA